MTDTQITQPPPDAAPTPRDLQRIALRDLVALATQSAATESEIEQRHAAAIQQSKALQVRTRRELENKYHDLQEQIRQKHQSRKDQLEAKSQQDLSALKARHHAARDRAQRDYASVEQDIKQKYEQAAWLADSVHDGTLARVKADHKAAQELHASHIASLDEVETRAVALLHKYNYPQAAQAIGGEIVNASAAEPTAEFEAAREQAVARLKQLDRLSLPRMFVGARPALLAILFLILATAGGQLTRFILSNGTINIAEPQWKEIGMAAGGMAVLLMVLGVILRIVGKSHIRQTYAPLRSACETARRASAAQLEAAGKLRETRAAEIARRRTTEIQAAKEAGLPALSQAAKGRDAALKQIDADFAARQPQVVQQHQQATQALDEWLAKHLGEAEQRYHQNIQLIEQRHQEQIASATKGYEEARAVLDRRLREGLAHIQAPLEPDQKGAHLLDWSDPAWNTWTPPRKFASSVRIGQLHVDLRKIADAVPRTGELRLQFPPAFPMPASLGFPRQASLLIQTDREGREEGIRTLQMTMARLLTTLPAGRVRFTIIDPVGLGQNFAGFMHLADHDEALVGGRIWTEAEHIEQRLTDLTEHMETVIQKYLRNEFETIDDYNAQAGELAEPYRFLVIADMPVGMEGDAFRRLASIASSGARCGVYTLVLRDLRLELPSGIHMDELEAASVNIVREDGRWVWKDEVFGQFPLTLDAPPAEETLTKILDVVGRHAKEAKRVEVPFETIAPQESQIWSGDTTEDLRVPVGRTGATRLQMLRLGKGVAQHALIAGKTGSGKSTLLHVLVTNMAMWYPPDQVEFYLIDFKKGVEFKTYATHVLPHARAIAVESDREFGLSVLHRLDAELTRRGELYRKLGVQDLAAYRAATASPSPGTPEEGRGEGRCPILPRTLLIIDEFQEFFSEDDKLAQDAALLLDRLVRQGRAFGIHVLLGSQTIGGSSGLARSTIGQMAVRIALQCSETDSQIILGDGNSAARLLTRPGEAIYNDAGGLVENNSPFQVSWLPDEKRDGYLERIASGKVPVKSKMPPREPVVFEGNAPADISKNRRLQSMVQSPWKAPTSPAVAFLGEPVAIKDPTSVTFRRQSGANLLLVGQQDQAAMAILSSAMLSLAAQSSPDGAIFYVIDGSAADSPLATVLPKVKDAIPHKVNIVEFRAVPEAMAEIAAEMQKRQGDTDHAGGAQPSIYIILYGLQRYRALRKQEESFSFSSEEGDKAPAADKLFADILREGPSVGIHTLVWADTPMTLERTLDRSSMREFDYRVLFQMSANDSSNLIDSPAANKLGFHRALAYSEEAGTVEKFRPYALIDPAFLTTTGESLKAKT